MAGRKEKDGKTEIQKFERLENKKSLLDEKKRFLLFLKSYHLMRK